MDEISIQAFFKFKKTEPAEISKRTRVCIHCSFRKQKCRLKSTTTNGCRHFGQSEQRKSSILFPIQSEKSPDSGFFICDPTKKCIMPSSRKRHKGIIGRGHDLRLYHEGPRDRPNVFAITTFRYIEGNPLYQMVEKAMKHTK